jgi:DNA-binding MarR family transcriptional regulator
VPFYHQNKTPASNAFTDLIRAILRSNATVQKSGTRLMQGTSITNARWQMLSELFALEQGVTVSELARPLGGSRQAILCTGKDYARAKYIQRLADDMVSDGMVEFIKNPGDARAMHLLLTEAGRAVLLKLMKPTIETIVRAFLLV